MAASTHKIWAAEPEPEGKSFNNFLNCIYTKQQKRLHDVYGTEYHKAAMGEDSGVTGGYLVPVEYSNKLMRVISERSFIFPRANVIPMHSQEMLCPKVDVETVQATNTNPFLGGLLFKWGSSQAPSETEPTFRQMSLTAWDLIGYGDMSKQFLMDTGPEGEEYLFRLFGRAAAWYAEFAFLKGTGASNQMPMGLVNAPATISQTRTGGAGTLAVKDVTQMSGVLIPYSWENAIWACHPTMLNLVQQLGSYFINIELGGIHKAAPQAAGVLFTRPLFVTDKLNTEASLNGALMLFDPTLYTIGARSEVMIDVSEHSRFSTYQVEYRVWLRLDGRPQVDNQITAADGSTKISPYVLLK